MLIEQSRWTYAADHFLRHSYDPVRLLPQYVLVPWMCMRRSDGTLLWDRRIRRANTIMGIQDGVIVASEVRSDGPWTLHFGCYGIDLETGDMLWASHRDGLYGAIVRALDYLPGFTNELRDTPHEIRAGEVICKSGRVLDLRTGRLLRRMSRDALPPYRERTDPATQLYNTRPDRIITTVVDKRGCRVKGEAAPVPPVAVADDRFVSCCPPTSACAPTSRKHGADDIVLYGTDSRGMLTWVFQLSETGYHCQTNFYSYRLARPFVYFVVSEAEVYVPINPGKPRYARYNPARWHILTVDARTGKMIQDIILGQCNEQPARLEDVDEGGALFSLDNRRLVYYERIPTEM
ncbi:MAG: hypothetical protein NTY65_10860 [Planctomycetota bacterium]|nr:hypothetical protein [Planctomycetota bacterium]